MKRIACILLILWGLLIVGLSQHITINGGIPNHYLTVNEVLTAGVKVTQTLSGELGHFAPGDKVLLIQLSGITIDDSSPAFKTTEARTKKAFNSAGCFEILQVDEINTSPTDTVILFTDNVANAYNNGEIIQLVRFMEAENLTVTGTVNARKWDGKIGGIVALMALDSLKLQGNIDVSGQGFRGGAVPDELYTGGCRYDLSENPDEKDTLYFYSYELNRSGNKGEGAINASWPYTKGSAFNINGGGAGNGYFSGGGGGGHFGPGGDGGMQSAFCTGSYSVSGGWGGYYLKELYSDPKKPKILMGGGGGSGTKSSSSLSSKGGDGGGIVILITGTLISNSSANAILANGESAGSALTYGAGGGGGAAGTVIIDATGVSSTFAIRIRGGNGGSTTATPCNGAGGSGSGGVFWHAGASFPAITIDSTAGVQGFTDDPVNCGDQGGNPGSTGTKLKRLILPLNGFLFNSVKGTDTVLCAGQAPQQGLTGSQPKGGNGVYSYVWQQSTDKVSWNSATGGTNVTLRTFDPPVLSQTTYYRRLVQSDTITDISRAIKIFVYPAIANNSITGNDTICYNLDAKPLSGIATPLTGGNGSYTYQWQERTNLTSWSNISSGTSSGFDPANLTATTHFRRTVYSTAYCSDTSDSATVTVLPLITGNAFSSAADTAICMNTSPGKLNTLAPNGGDNNYVYQWQQKTLSGDWTDIASSNVPEYTVGTLEETTDFNRVVFSGNDNACADTCDTPKRVIVRPLISNNTVLGSSVKYACYNNPIQLTGSEPGDGFGAGSYAYVWEQSSDNITWETTAGNAISFLTPGLTEPRYFRRIVYSSQQLKECSDISDTVEVRINALPTGNVIAAFDTLCAGETLYVKFTVSGNGPFSVTLGGDIEPDQTKTGITGPIDSIAFAPLATQQFTMVIAEDDSSCLADAAGFVPITPATVYAVPDANAGADDEICGDTYTLQAAKSIPASQGLWAASGATFAEATDENSSVTVSAYGPNNLTWTESNWHCTDADEVEITFSEQPQLADAGPDQVLDFIYTAQLEAVPALIGGGKWTIVSGAGEFDNDTLPNAVINELSSGTSLKWTVTNGQCPALEDIMNILINPLTIDKGFTPDGNGKHDDFTIDAPDAEWITLKVYNSAGVLVFESDNYRAAKDGEGDLWSGYTMDGVELPEGTYFYIATMKITGKSEEVQFRSFVEIMR